MTDEKLARFETWINAPSIGNLTQFQAEQVRGMVQPLIDEIRAQAARILAVTRALKMIQWGSCDGCGNMHKCPICRGEKEHWEEDLVPGKHKPDCVIGATLTDEGPRHG